MNTPLRIVFAYCSDDPWIAVVAKDLEKASKNLGCELYVIAAGEHGPIKKESFINSDSFHRNYYLSTVFSTLQYPNIDLTELSNIESMFLKQLGGGKPEPPDVIKNRLHAWLAEAMMVLKIIQPDMVIVWNGLYSKRAVYVKAAHYLKIPLYYAEKGMLPNSWYIDAQGVNLLSSVAGQREMDLGVSLATIGQFKQRIQTIDRKGESAWEQPQRQESALIRKNLGLKENQKVLFFPGQVDHDTNIVLFSKHFLNSLDALKWLVNGLPNDEFFIVAKPHPKGNANLEAFEKVLANKGLVLQKINVLDAIELADCVVSINSTIAFEAAVRAKPVLLLGQGLLCNREFVSTYIQGVDAYDQVVGCIEKYNNDKEALHLSALVFATYLDTVYYAYRGDKEKTERLLSGLIAKSVNRTDKFLNQEEIAAFFQDIPYEDFKKSFLQAISHKEIANWFSARMLTKALFEKIQKWCTR